MEKEVAIGANGIRASNRRLLLQILRSEGEISRGQLASAAELSAAAVTNVVADLLDAGLVVECEPVKDSIVAKMGRPATRLSLAGAGPVVVAVQIGVGQLQVGICDLKGSVLGSQHVEFHVSDSPEEVIAQALRMVRRLLRRTDLSGATVIGTGIGAAGALDEDQRAVSHQKTLGWRDVQLADAFEKGLGAPAVVDHNVRAMAIGESRYGVGRGLDSLAFVYVRNGVGAGLILDGKAYRSRRNTAAEFGHTRVSGSGLPCDCGGHGCLQTVVSDRLLKNQMQAMNLNPTPEAFCAAVTAGNAGAVALRDQMVEHLATGLLNIVNLLNPDVIVLGGLLYDLHSILNGPLQESLSSRVLPIFHQEIRMEPSAHGQQAGLVGAATVALDRFVFGESQMLASKAS